MTEDELRAEFERMAKDNNTVHPCELSRNFSGNYDYGGVQSRWAFFKAGYELAKANNAKRQQELCQRIENSYGVKTMTSSQKTITIPCPELPEHIAKEWEIVDCRPPKRGDRFLDLTGRSIAIAKHDYDVAAPCYILRRREPEWEPPQWLRESRFCKLWCDEDGWWLATDTPGSRYDLSVFFPRMIKPTDKAKVYTW